jgi:hypothetical protein
MFIVPSSYAKPTPLEQHSVTQTLFDTSLASGEVGAVEEIHGDNNDSVVDDMEQEEQDEQECMCSFNLFIYILCVCREDV